VQPLSDGGVSSLVHMSAEEPMAQIASDADAHFSFVPAASHYDGVYYYAIAIDPFARSRAHTLIDSSAYRYGHPGYAWLANVIGFGKTKWIPMALLIVNLISLTIGAALVSLIAREIGRTPWWGLIVGLMPGFLFAVTVDTAEPPLLLFCALGAYLWIKDKRILAALALTAASFIREIGVLVPLGLFLYELISWFRNRDWRVKQVLLTTTLLAIGPLLYAGWWIYVHSVFHRWPTFPNITAPFAGPLHTLTLTKIYTDSGASYETQLGLVAIPLVVALIVAFSIGIIRSIRVRNVFQGVFIVMALLVLSLNWYLLLFPKELIRTIAVPVVFLAFAFAAPEAVGRRRSEIMPPV
jgi:hypothetical protein